MKLRRQLSVLFLIHLICFSVKFSLKAQKKLGAFILSKEALEEFAPDLYTGPKAYSIGDWTKKWNAKRVKEGTKINGERYVVYRVNLLSYWFGPFKDNQSQLAGLNKLYQIRNQLIRHGLESSIFIAPIFLNPNHPISISEFPRLRDDTPLFIVPPDELKAIDKKLDTNIKQLKQFEVTELPENLDGISERYFQTLKQQQETLDKINESLEQLALDQKTKIAINNLRKKHGDFQSGKTPNYSSNNEERNRTKGEHGGKGKKNENGSAKKGNGLTGWFPVSYSFSRWFAITLDVLSDIFLPAKLKSIAQKVLTLAYMISPDLMDRIASTIAKLQDAVTPNKLDSALNKVADVAKYAYMLYKDLQKLHNLIEDPAFKELLKDMKLQDAANHLKKASLKYGIKFPGVFGKYFPYADCMNWNNFKQTNQLGNCIKKQLKEEVKKQISKNISRMPGLNKLDPAAINQLIEGGKWEKFVKYQAKHITCGYVPGRHRGNCQNFLDGNFEKATIAAISLEVEEKTGIPSNSIENFYQSVKDNDYKKALKTVAKEGSNRYFGLYAPIVNDLIEDNIKFDTKKAKLAIQTFIENTVDNKWIRGAIGTGAHLFEEIVINGEHQLKQIVKSGLEKNGFSERAAENIVNGNVEIEIDKLAKDFAVEIGFTNPQAIEAIKKGNFEKALDAQLQFLENQNFGPGEQLKHVQQLVKNQKEFTDVWGKVLKEQLNDTNYKEKVALENKLQASFGNTLKNSSASNFPPDILTSKRNITGEYTFYLRSFHPKKRFGSFAGTIGKGFEGDNRGFSVSANVTSRISHSVTLIPSEKKLLYDQRRTYSDPSSIEYIAVEHSGIPGTPPDEVRIEKATKTGKPKGFVSRLITNNNSYKFTTGYKGRNPLIPSPYIDIQSSIILTEDSKLGYITVTYHTKGDNFPSTEMFIEDKFGRRLFLGIANRNSVYDTAPFILFGRADVDIIRNTVRIILDEEGGFMGINYKGRTYGISNWNALFK